LRIVTMLGTTFALDSEANKDSGIGSPRKNSLPHSKFRQESERPHKRQLSIQRCLEDLPNYFYGKGVELIDKSAMQAVYFAFSIAQGMDAAFSNKFGESSANVQISLKNSKEFKEWHRGVEDFIDDVLKGTRHHLKKFASVIKSVTGNESLANQVKVLQSFDYFKDRTDLAAQMDSSNFTAWGLSEVSKLLDIARSKDVRKELRQRNPFASKGTGDGMKGRSGGFGDNSSMNDCTMYIEDIEKSGFLPELDRSKSMRSIGDDKFTPNLRARSSRSIDQAAKPKLIDNQPNTKVAVTYHSKPGHAKILSKKKSISQDSENFGAGSSNDIKNKSSLYNPFDQKPSATDPRPLSSYSNSKTQSEVKIEPQMIRLDADLMTIKKSLGTSVVPQIKLNPALLQHAQSQDSTSRDAVVQLAPVKIAPKQYSRTIIVEKYAYKLPAKQSITPKGTSDQKKPATAQNASRTTPPKQAIQSQNTPQGEVGLVDRPPAASSTNKGGVSRTSELPGPAGAVREQGVTTPAAKPSEAPKATVVEHSKPATQTTQAKPVPTATQQATKGESPKKKDVPPPHNTPVHEREKLKDSSEMRIPIMKGDPRVSMSELTVRSGPKGKDPTIYPHIIQHESRFVLM
jgi:hypothetical protein